MEKISLCMIVQNEEQNLRRCLESVVSVVDEIILIDTGSTDNTPQIAAEFGAQVYSFEWKQNFSEARNASLERARGDWILILDGDEELAPESREVLRRLTDDGTVDGYFVKIINYMGNEGWLETSEDVVFRLFRNRKDYRFHGAVHEQIADVILTCNSQARYQMAEDLAIIHYGYLDQQVADKEKKIRNLQLIEGELQKDPSNRLVRYHLGVEMYRAGRFSEAVSLFLEAASGLDPQTIYLPKLIRYLVLSYDGLQAYQQGLEITLQGLRLFPNYADLYYYGGLMAYHLKEYGRAGELWKQALSMPEQPPYFASFNGVRGFRTRFYLGQLAEKFFNEDEAMTQYVWSLRDNPRFLIALDQVIRLLKPREDREYADRCLGLLCEPGDREGSLQLGKMLFQHRAYALALAYLEEGAAETPEVKLWKGICLLQQGRYLEAMPLFQEFQPDQPLYPLAKLNQLIGYWNRGNRRKVQELGRELKDLGLSPDTEAVVGLLRDSWGKGQGPLVDMGEEGGALFLDILGRILDRQELQQAQSLLKQLSKAFLQKNAQTLGKIFLHYGYFDEAEKYLIMDLKTHPEEADVLFNLGEIKERQDNPWEAIHYYRKTMAAEPKEPRGPLRLSRLYRKLRREILQEALRAEPQASLLQSLYQEVAEEDG